MVVSGDLIDNGTDGTRETLYLVLVTEWL
jgi:hypothetical protein